MNEKSIEEKIAEGYYQKSQTPYPNESEIKEEVWKGFDEFVGTKKQIDEEEARREKEVRTRVCAQKEKRSQELRALEEEFKKDLLTDFGILKNKRADKCFNLGEKRETSIKVSDSQIII